MKRKILKKIITLFISTIFVTVSSMVVVNAAAENLPPVEVQPRDVDYYTGTLWEYVSSSSGGTSTGAREKIDEHKAGRNGAGETLSVTFSKSYGVTLSGGITVGSANKAIAQFGVQVGGTKGLSIARTSRELKAFETVIAYAVPKYNLRNVTEREISYTLSHGKYIRYQPTGKTRTGTVKIPSTLSVQFSYSS